MLNLSHSLLELVNQISEYCKDNKYRIATAESCTGGLVSATLTSMPGSSDWFECGYLTYSNTAKRKMLGVRASTLDEEGAVSEETAKEMAEGALAKAKVAYALSITGIAGPTGGTDEKPVGTVCFAWARAGADTVTETCHFSGDRAAVREKSLIYALKGMVERLS